jgi:hypothetical protein
VNNIVFFIGGLSCAPTDPALLRRFAPHQGTFHSITKEFRDCVRVRFGSAPPIILCQNYQPRTAA